MRTPISRFGSLLCVSALLLGVSGCAGDALPSFSPFPSTPAPGMANAGTGAPTDAAAPTPDPTPAAGAGDCLSGSWIIPEAELDKFYADAIGSVAGFEITGDALVDFRDGNYEYTPRFTLKMSVAGHESSGTSSGSIVGSYTSDGETLTTTHDVSTVSITVTVMGQSVETGGDMGSLTDAAPFASAPYTCDSGKPVIMFQTRDGGRMPIALRAA